MHELRHNSQNGKLYKIWLPTWTAEWVTISAVLEIFIAGLPCPHLARPQEKRSGCDRYFFVGISKFETIGKRNMINQDQQSHVMGIQ